jgi:ribonuclease HI
MGAAFTSLTSAEPDSRLEMQALPGGIASSVRAELSAILLALRCNPTTEHLTILTDSLVSLLILQDAGKMDFQRDYDTHPNRKIINEIIDILTVRHNCGTRTHLAKIPAHAGEPLNERADFLAGSVPPTTPSFLEPDSQHRCRFSTEQSPGTEWQ